MPSPTPSPSPSGIPADAAETVAQERLEATQSMLRIAARMGRLGAWSCDPVQARLSWSPEICAMFEVPAGATPTLEEVIAFYEAPSQPAMRAGFLACLREGLPFDLEAPCVTAGGRPIWVRTIGHAQIDWAGDVQHVHGACQDISDSKRAQDEILRLNAELEDRVRQRTAQLEAANRELEAFAYSIAHDLRAPLSSIDGFSHALESGAQAQLDERGRHYLRRIRNAVHHLGQLADGLLALAHLSRTPVRLEPVDLAVLARAALQALREREPQRQLQDQVAPNLPVLGDPRLLAQVVDNLVGNAWKFTARTAAARVEVGSRQQVDGETVYFVCDNGVGFDMAHAARLFDAFQRLHTAAEFEGTGIGLAIVHRIVTRHGGRIWAQAAPQQGACFLFTLPAPACAVPAADT